MQKSICSFFKPFHLIASLALCTLAMLGCAHEGQVEGGSSPRVSLSDEASSSSGQRSPSSVCSQYMAMLSADTQQQASPRYGNGGECWSGGDSLAKQCETECRGRINRIIRANLETTY